MLPSIFGVNPAHFTFISLGLLPRGSISELLLLSFAVSVIESVKVECLIEAGEGIRGNVSKDCLGNVSTNS